MRRAPLLAAIPLLAACRNEAPPVPTNTAPAAPAPPSGAISAASGHPRLWITAADLPRLRGWVDPKNPMWQDGLRPAVEQAIATYDRDFFPGGQPNPTWPDPGIDNWVGKCTEAYAEIFAFMSLVDPDPAARAQHAERARRLLMHVIEEAEKGADPDRKKPAPFRSAAFATYNRANYWGEAFGLTVDWIYPSLSAADKARIRKVFMRWSAENVNAATSGNEHPQPVGVMNDPRLLADKKRLRWAANNYYTGHMRQIVLLSLALDQADDPPEDRAAPRAKLGNTLESYLHDAVGAWLYQQYAVYEDPAVAAPALGVPPAGLGVASGGLSPEGFLYGPTIGNLHEALLALYTAGYRDAAKLGPQIRLIESAYWDRYADGLLHSITPAPLHLKGHGEVYPIANYGDTLRAWITPEHDAAFGSMAVYDTLTGNAARLAKDRWFMTHAIEGGAPKLFHRASAIWGNSSATRAVLHFLAFDPAAPPPPDPRPSLPLDFHDKALGRIIARSAWGPASTMFDYKCSWSTIGHQFGDCNQIELWRKGEWLTKERSGYANDLVIMAPDHHNTLGIQNTAEGGADKPKGLQWFEGKVWERGGQWGLGTSAGDPVVRASFGPGWVVAEGDARDLYNRTRGGDAVDVEQASRTVAWIRPDEVVIYDRAQTRSEGKFKRFFLSFAGEPKVDGKRVTVTTPHGQQLFVQTLLPQAAVLTARPAESFNRVAEGELSRFQLMVEDPASPRAVRFLHTLEAADPGAAPSPAAMVRSSAGAAFTGAVLGSTAVLFSVDLGAPVSSVTYAVPASTKAQLVTGLSPGARYDVTTRRSGGSIEVTIKPGSARQADEAGVIALGSLAPSAP